MNVLPSSSKDTLLFRKAASNSYFQIVFVLYRLCRFVLEQDAPTVLAFFGAQLPCKFVKQRSTIGSRFLRTFVFFFLREDFMGCMKMGRKKKYSGYMTKKMYDTCQDAMRDAQKKCGRPNHTEGYQNCLREKCNILSTRQDASRTQCILSGDSSNFFAVVKDATETSQMVYGAPLFGGPSKMTDLA